MIVSSVGIRRVALLVGLTVAGVAWAAGADKDGDGVPNARDACPGVAEDVDGFRDGDGCLDRDNDADGVPDAVDSCPDSPGRGGAACPDYVTPELLSVPTPAGAPSRTPAPAAAGDTDASSDTGG